MSELSSHNLFHFTHSLDVLKLILKNGIRYSVVMERIPGAKLVYAVDAVCFCCIPLSSVNEHVFWYGPYGIGVRPSVLRQAGATPIIYAHPNSPFLKKGRGKLEYYQNDCPFTAYIKQIKGSQRRYGCHKPSTKLFYDEKEWRLANRMTLNVYQQSDVGDLEQARRDLKSSSQKPESIPLPSEWIEYILVRFSNEKQTLSSWLQSEGMAVLSNRIISLEQIRKDF